MVRCEPNTAVGVQGSSAWMIDELEGWLSIGNAPNRDRDIIVERIEKKEE